MKNRNKKKSHGGIYLFICLFFFVLAWDGELQIEMLLLRTRGTPQKHFNIQSLRCVFSFTSSSRKEEQSGISTLNMHRCFLQTTNLCLIHLQDKGSTWIPEREQCMCTRYALPFKSQKESSLLVSERSPRPTASQALANVLNVI